MEFKILSKDIKSVSVVADKLSKLMTEGYITVEEGKIKIYGQDKANISMYVFYIAADIVQVDESQDLFVNFLEMAKVMKKISGDLTFKTANNCITVSDAKKKFTLPTYEIPQDRQVYKQMPAIPYEFSTEIDTETLSDAISAVEVVAESDVYFEVRDTELFMKGVDGNKKAEVILASDLSASPIITKFSYAYVSQMCDCLTQDTCTIYLKEGTPLMLKDSFITMLLAPLVIDSD